MIVDKTTITKMTTETSQSNCGADSEFFPDNNASIWPSSSTSRCIRNENTLALASVLSFRPFWCLREPTVSSAVSCGETVDQPLFYNSSLLSSFLPRLSLSLYLSLSLFRARARASSRRAPRGTHDDTCTFSFDAHARAQTRRRTCARARARVSEDTPSHSHTIYIHAHAHASLFRPSTDTPSLRFVYL